MKWNQLTWVILGACLAAGPVTRPVEGGAGGAATRAATRPVSRPAIHLTSRPATRPTTAPAEIDLSTLATQAGAVSINLRQMQADVGTDRVSPEVEGELPGLTAEIQGRFEETSSLLASNPSLQVLDEEDQDWQTIGHELERWSRALDHRRDAAAGADGDRRAGRRQR